MRKQSLYPTVRECIVCGNPYVELHHIYYGNGRRKVSDREGCTVFLCHAHHQGAAGVHGADKSLDRWLKRDCQKRWMEREEEDEDGFRAVFGASYLGGER